ncbi:MAG: hypothetical protein IPI38_14060 [Gemmatimonadetes bacterium]|jgi:hypothetical protein|nr:hypothetical protein [Gemmatimonadota bacterium]MBP6669915.1 hypothetical protein [Gemmatimonadales bacterium]MBK7716529.1 hypothetical protein [Gemmatimonadota bacterium]MBK7925075.1 hypothetical protein [Gemmatimonadota bacterium]MBK9693617.1 hypothetical protein [Gemmatimonadota bacterium]
MVRPFLLSLLLLLLAIPAAAQHSVARSTLQRGVAAIRLRAMLAGQGTARPPAAALVVDPRAAMPLRIPDRAGRLVTIPLASALDLRAGILWWPTGPRALAGFRYRY